MRSRLSGLLPIFSLTLLFVAIGFAQEFRATVTGHVVDTSSASIPGAVVQIRNTATNEIASTTTDSQGNYTIPFLKPGSYNLSVEANGFKKVTHENLVLNVGQTASFNLTLEVGTVTESLTVTAEAPLLETAKADRGLVIDEQRVREFPLNARNPFMLSLLTAGVNFNGNIIYQRPFDNGAIADWNINGSYDRNNEFLLDGAPNNGQAGNNNIALVPSVDAVQEFKIQTNSYDAQYGKTAGGIVNVSLKSGTNGFHGTLYEFARRIAWDANSFQNNARGADKRGCVPTDTLCLKDAQGHYLDQYGGTIGGPIIFPKLYNGRNKSFFFGAYEGYREGTPTPLSLSVPQPEFLQGDFSNLKDTAGRQIVIYNPFTGRDVNGTWTRDPFTNNKIPGDMLNPIATKLLNLFPKPNVPSSGSFYSQNNYAVQSIDQDTFYNLMLRFDQNIGDKQRIFFRHASNDRTEIRPTNDVQGPGADGQLPLKRVNDAYVADWVGTISPTFIANVRASWNRYIEGSRGDPDKGHPPTEVGFPASLVSQLSLPDWFGRYEFDNYQALGRFYSFNYTNTFALNPNITKIHNGHSIHAGLDFRVVVYNNQNPGNPFRLQSTRAFTQKVYNTGDSLSGNSLASFLLGTLPGGGNNGADYNVLTSSVQRYYAPYIQDDWKVTRKLTLNVGLRWDFNLAPFERHDRINRGFDPNVVNPVDKLIDRTAFPGFPTVKGGLLFAGVNGADRKAGNLDWTAIQPRIGFAYQLTPKMVWRGGFGKYYLNPNNDYLQSAGFSYTTPVVGSLDGGRSPIRDLLNNPFPAGITVPTGSSLGALTFAGRQPNFFDPSFHVPYVNQFSLGFQYELPFRSALEVSYVGNRSYKLENLYDYNEPNLAFRKQCDPLEGGKPSFCDALVPNPFFNLQPFAGTSLGTSPTISRFNLNRPFPEFGSFQQRGRNDGKVWYNSMQVAYQIRGAAGMNLTFAYTYSKMIEQAALSNSFMGAGTAAFTDIQQQITQRSVYAFDRPHVLKIGTVWELPFGKGKHFLNTSHPVLSRLVSGWQHTMIMQYNSGRPWEFPGNVVYLKDAAINNIDWSSPKIYGVRPCVLKMSADGSVAPQPYSISYGCGTDPSTYNFLFVPSSLYAPRMSPLHFNNLRLHATPQFDMSVNKLTRITEHTSVQFRAEAFNIMNTFYLPIQQFTNNVDDANFGSIIKGTTAQGNANFPRQIQLAVKFIF
jgi:carboxypeptidase family protein